METSINNVKTDLKQDYLRLILLQVQDSELNPKRHGFFQIPFIHSSQYFFNYNNKKWCLLTKLPVKCIFELMSYRYYYVL